LADVQRRVALGELTASSLVAGGAALVGCATRGWRWTDQQCHPLSWMGRYLADAQGEAAVEERAASPAARGGRTWLWY